MHVGPTSLDAERFVQLDAHDRTSEAGGLFAERYEDHEESLF